MEYKRKVQRSKPQLLEDARMWELYSHHLIDLKNDIMRVSEKDEPLYSFLLKSEKLKQIYTSYESRRPPDSNNSIVDELIGRTGKDNEDEQQKRDLLMFPFDQVSQGQFLAYFLEAILNRSTHSIASTIGKDIGTKYRIHWVTNLKMLFDRIKKEFGYNVLDFDINPEGLTKINYAMVNTLFWLLFQSAKLDKIVYDSEVGEKALLLWAKDCCSLYPGIDADEMTFEHGFLDGLAFCYIYHSYNPDLIDLSQCYPGKSDENLKIAFEIGWNRCNIPHVIQNHNLHHHSIILYLSMMFDYFHNSVRSTFVSRNVGLVFKRFLDHETLKSDAHEHALELNTEIQSMKDDVSAVLTESYLPREKVDILYSQYVDLYKLDKKDLLQDMNQLSTDYFHLKCLSKTPNHFPEYQPPQFEKLSAIFQSFFRLTDHEVKYMNVVSNLYATSSLIEYLQNYFETLSEDIRQEVYQIQQDLNQQPLDTTKLESFQSFHQQVESCIVQVNGVQGLLSLLELVDFEIKKYLIEPKPNIEETKEIVAVTMNDFLDTRTKIESQMVSQIDAEVLVFQFNNQCREFCYECANAILMLQAPYLDPRALRQLFAAIDQFLLEKSQERTKLAEMEQRVISMEQETDIRIQTLSDVLQDVLTYKQAKENQLQDPMKTYDLRERVEKIGASINVYILNAISIIEENHQPLPEENAEDFFRKGLESYRGLSRERKTFEGHIRMYEQMYDELLVTNSSQIMVSHDKKLLTRRLDLLNESLDRKIAFNEKYIELVDNIATTRLDFSSLAGKLSDFFKHGIREMKVSTSIDERTLRVWEENLITKSTEMKRFTVYFHTLTQPLIITPSLRNNVLPKAKSVFDEFTEFSNALLGQWNSYTKEIASMKVINAGRLKELQHSMTQFINEKSQHIADIQTRDEVLTEVIDYASEWIYFDEIKHLSHLANEDAESNGEDDETNEILASLTKQWTKLWSLIKKKVRCLVEGEGDTITPAIRLLHEQFQRKISILQGKATTLYNEYCQEEDKHIALILKTVSEIQADLHHSKVFYELFQREVDKLDDPALQKQYRFHNFEQLHKYIDKIRREIELDVLKAFQHEELKQNYLSLAKEFLESVGALKNELSEGLDEATSQQDLSLLEKKYNECQNNLTILSRDLDALKKLRVPMKGYSDRVDFGDYSTDILTKHLNLCSELLQRVKNQISTSKERMSFFVEVRKWMNNEASTVSSWLKDVELLIQKSTSVQTLDDILILRRELQHKLQETRLMNLFRNDAELMVQTYQDVVVQQKVENLEKSWTVIIPKIQEVLAVLTDLEADYIKRQEYISQIGIDIDRISCFINILKTKEIERPSNFYGRVPLNLIKSYLGDCSVLDTYISQMPDLLKVNISSIESHSMLHPVNERIDKLQEEYKKVRMLFQKTLSTITHKLETYARSEKDLYDSRVSYTKLTKPFLNLLVGIESEFAQNSSEAMQTLSQTTILEELKPKHEHLQKIHNHCSTKIIESVPFDIIEAKWKRFLRMIRSSDVQAGISINNMQRQKELQRNILDSAAKINEWIEKAMETLQIASQISVVSHSQIQKAKSALHEITKLHSEEQGTQYSRIVQLLNLQTELILFGWKDKQGDISQIIKTIENKWMVWLNNSKTIESKLAESIRKLILSEYQRQTYENSKVGIEEWINRCLREVQSIESQKIHTMDDLQLYIHQFSQWMQEKHHRYENIRTLQNISENASLPDPSVQQNIQQIKHMWSELESVCQEKETLLAKLSNHFSQQRKVELEILQSQESIIQWISRERMNLLNAIQDENSLNLKSVIEKTQYRIHQEATPILSYLKNQPMFQHKNLLENHWSSFIFVLERAKIIRDELIEKEFKRNGKLSTFGNHLNMYQRNMNELMNTVQEKLSSSQNHSIVEMEDNLNHSIVLYSELEKIVATFVSILEDLDAEDDVLIDHQATKDFETYCIDTFTKYESLFYHYADEYETRKKSEGISAAYFALHSTLDAWQSKQVQFFSVLSSETESLTNLATRKKVYTDYINERPQISLLYKQMTEIWATLSRMGIVLETGLPTPVDIKNRIEKLDDKMSKGLTRNEALLNQFDYVLTMRQNWIETALSLAQQTRDANQLLSAGGNPGYHGPDLSLDNQGKDRHSYGPMSNYGSVSNGQSFANGGQSYGQSRQSTVSSKAPPRITSYESPEISFQKQKTLLESLRKRQGNTERVLMFLTELKETMVEQCIVLPKNDWDESLDSILSILEMDTNLLGLSIETKEIILSKWGDYVEDIAHNRQRVMRIIRTIDEYLLHTKGSLDQFLEKEPKINRMEKMNEIAKFVQENDKKAHLIFEIQEMIAKMEQMNFMEFQDIDFNPEDIFHRWQEIRELLNEAIGRISLIGFGIPTMTDSSDVQLFLEILYMNIWILDNCKSLEKLLQLELRRDNVNDLLFQMAVLGGEMEANKKIIDRVLSVDSDSNELVQLGKSWTRLEELYENSLQKLTDHLMVRYNFEHDRKRLLHLHETLCEFTSSEQNLLNPPLVRQVYNFYYGNLIPELFEKNINLTNLLREDEIETMTNDFAIMKRTLSENMNVDQNYEQDIEKKRLLIVKTFQEVFKLFVEVHKDDIYNVSSYKDKWDSLANVTKDCERIIHHSIEPLRLFVESISEEYQSIHVTLLNLLETLIERIVQIIPEMQKKIANVRNQRESLILIRKKFSQKIISLINRMEKQQSTLHKYEEGSLDPDVDMSLLQRSFNPSLEFRPKNDATAQFIEKLVKFPDTLQKDYDILQTLYSEMMQLSEDFNELCILHQEKILVEEIPIRFELNEDHSIKEMVTTWGSIRKSIEDSLNALPVADLEKSSRITEKDMIELKNFYNDAPKAVQDCSTPDTNSFIHIQHQLYYVKLFSWRWNMIQDKYERVLHNITQSEHAANHMEILTEQHSKLQSMLDKNPIPFAEIVLQRMEKALSYNHAKVDYEGEMQRLYDWIDEQGINLDDLKSKLDAVRKEPSDDSELEKQMIDLEYLALAIQLFQNRSIVIDRSLEEIKMLEDRLVNFSEFFNEKDLQLSTDKGNFDIHRFRKLWNDQNQILDFNFQTMNHVKQGIDKNITEAITFVKDFNSLLEYVTSSVSLFKDIDIDCSEVEKYIRHEIHEWSRSFEEKYQPKKNNIFKQLKQKGSKALHYAHALTFFAVVDVDEFEEFWNDMIKMKEARVLGIDDMITHRSDCLDSLELNPEVIDSLERTFIHFSRYNNIPGDDNRLERDLVGRYLVSIGFDLPYDQQNDAVLSIISICGLDPNLKLIAFEDIVKYLKYRGEFKDLEPRNAKELIHLFQKLEKQYWLNQNLTWGLFVDLFGGILDHSQLSKLRSFMRDNVHGIDYVDLCSKCFGKE